MKASLNDRFQPLRMALAMVCGLWFAIQPSLAAQVVWSGFDAISNVNTNWSDANNWSSGTPGPATSILLINAGAVTRQGSVNNILDVANTISMLQYANTNNFHTTQINSGVTLTVSNTAATSLVFAGTATDNGNNQTLYASMTGAGAFVVGDTNSGSAFVVQQGSSSSGSHAATLDLSGLANFSLTAGKLLVAGYNLGFAGPSNNPSGTLYLARTNYIRVNGTVPGIDVGDANSSPGNLSYLYLGQTNAIFADSMTIGHSKSAGTLAFNPALANTNPVLFLSGNTNTRMALLTIGDDSAESTSIYSYTGTMNLNGGTVNAQVNICYLGLGQTGNGAGSPTGVLDVGAGVFNVNMLYAGYVSSITATSSVYGTLNVSNGMLVVNSSLVLGYNPGAAAAAYGTLNITNGTVLANAIIAGAGTNKITMTGGWLAISNTLGSPAAPLSSLTVSNGATLQFWVANNFTNAAISKLAGDSSGAISIGAVPLVLNYPSQYPLIYSPAGGASGVKFALDTLPNGYRGYISNDNSSTIWLVITNGPALPKTDLWVGGVNNHWDANILNWTSNGVAVAYDENDLVLFNDSAQSSQVNLVGSAPHTPYAWTVTNNILNYKFTGTNSVAGMVGLVKSGTAFLTLAESGDSFSGGITVNGGTVVLDEAASVITGGLTIASGATAQIGNNDTNGSLPSGMVSDNGALVFSQTIMDLVTTSISGTGSLTQNGSGILELSATNNYTGNTFVLQGTLALTGGGSISSSANVVVSHATLDVSGGAGATSLGNLNMTNGVLNVGGKTVNVSNLNLGGSSNTINAAVAGGLKFNMNGSELEMNPAGEGITLNTMLWDGTNNNGPDLTVSSLSGSGIIANPTGAVTVNCPGSVSPGMGTALGALSFNSSLVLAGTTTMKLNRTNDPNADLISAANITWGGTLTVTNCGPPLQAGDIFELFYGAISGQFAATNLPTLSPTNLFWDFTLFNNQGIIMVGGGNPGTPVTMLQSAWSHTNLVLPVVSQAGMSYVLQATPKLQPSAWVSIQTNTGDGMAFITNQIQPGLSQQFYRIKAVQPLLVQSATAPTNAPWKWYSTVTLDDLPAYLQAETDVGLSQYGGLLARQTNATGYFHTLKINNRWWLVDPEGYLFFNQGVDNIYTINSTGAEAALTADFGTVSNWAAATTTLLRQYAFNSAGAWSDTTDLRAVSSPLVYTIIQNFEGTYSATNTGPGYPYVFDPAFVTFCNNFAQQFANTQNDPWLLGYFSDNELPFSIGSSNLLVTFLGLPSTNYSYQAAWTWLRALHGADATTNSVTAQDKINFCGYVWGQYYKLVSQAIKTADPNHLYLGTKFNGPALNQPVVFTNIGPYVDVVSVDLYGEWTPDTNQIQTWESSSGRPVLIAEWYVKGADSGMTNSTGAGWVVPTQSDRGYFYENFALTLLQTRDVVGWHWFKYADNDPTAVGNDPSNINSNKGIVNNRYVPYYELLNAAQRINVRIHRLANYFDGTSGP